MKEYINNGRVKVYLAGPFFNEEQDERITYIETVLKENNFDVFSPRHASRIKPGCSQEDMLATFRGNVDNIFNADLVLAILDGNDTGTMFECGYAYSAGIPTLYFNETRPKEKGPNLMLALSTDLPYLMNNEMNSARAQLQEVLSVISGCNDVVEASKRFKTNEFSEVE